MPQKVKKMDKNKVYLFTVSIYLIIFIEFCERVSFCGIKTILSLYLTNVLKFSEKSSTLIYHIFIMLCYLSPVVGALFADSILGRFWTICFFSLMYASGSTILCLASLTPTSLYPIPFTIWGLVLIALGTGGIKPCIAAFGGDQFTLDEQEKLKGFFSFFYFFLNVGAFMGMLLIPFAHKIVGCFGVDSCYPLAYGVPAFLMILSLAMFVIGKPCYKIKVPKINIVRQFVTSTKYALGKMKRSPDTIVEHWLDHARDKYGSKHVTDMKIILHILFLYIPLPAFWCLFDQQGSRWTFQASRMSGKVYEYEVFPDQMQALNPIIVLMLIPIFDKLIYPLCGKLNVLSSPLHRMAVGGCLAGMAFVASGLVELRLQDNYPLLTGEPQLNIINTLPCDIWIKSSNGKVLNISATSSYNGIHTHNFSNFDVRIYSPPKCGEIDIRKQNIHVHGPLHKNKVLTLITTIRRNRVHARRNRHGYPGSPLHGKCKLRLLIMGRELNYNNMSLTLSSYQDMNKHVAINYDNRRSKYIVLNPGRYTIKLPESSVNLTKIVNLETQKVYCLIISDYGKKLKSELYEEYSAGDMNMLWLLPQYFLISVAEVMFAVSGLHFSFSQAPKSMKTFAIAAWYATMAIGNLIVVVITETGLFTNQAHEYFFYATFMIFDMIIFLVMSRNYKFVEPDYSVSSDETTESIPLLPMQPKMPEELLQLVDGARTSQEDSIESLSYDDELNEED